jgi:hypothetical protein
MSTAALHQMARRWLFAAPALALAATLACQSGRAPAEAALRLAQTAVDGARAEAQAMLPEEVRSLEEDLAAGRRSLEQGDYKAALAAAQTLQQRSNEVIAHARSRRDEMAAQWVALSAEMPGLIAGLMSQIDGYRKARKASKAADARRIGEAREQVGAATDAWNAAIEAHRSGNVPGALTRGREAKDRLEKAQKIVGPPPKGK